MSVFAPFVPAGLQSGALAAESSGVLLRSFAIALVIMAPIALWQGWRVRNRRSHQRSASYQQASELSSVAASADNGRTLEALVADINRVASTLEAAQTTEVVIPADLTVGGSRADPQLVEAVLRDALERSGLEVTGTGSDGDSVQLRCRRR